MKRRIVTLRSAPSATVEFPETVKVGKEEQKLERSCFGALRLFPGLPRAVSEDELKYIEKKYPALFRRLAVQDYVESKRVDLRGVTESDLDALAEKEGLGHLPPREKIRRLKERGKLQESGPRKVEPLRGKGKSTPEKPSRAPDKAEKKKPQG